MGQQLCQQSHTHRVTLQYCLWDFLRSLGESSIGGSGSSFGDERQQEFDNASVSSRRIANVAKAYGWWIAKDSLTISVLKVRSVCKFRILRYSNSGQSAVGIYISAYQDASFSAPTVCRNIPLGTRGISSPWHGYIKTNRNTRPPEFGECFHQSLTQHESCCWSSVFPLIMER